MRKHGVNEMLLLAVMVYNGYVPQASSFQQLDPAPYSSRANPFPSLTMTTPESSADQAIDDDVARQLQRAQELLAQSKEKLAKVSGENMITPETMPFFASRTSSVDREDLIKNRDENTGLITTDGEKMAKMSEKENWEQRRLTEVFENEIGESESLAAQQLADRDVAVSIWNLRKSMMNEDYQKIFDKKNRFIGEDN